MANLGFKRLTAENWMEPDPILSFFVTMSLADGSTRVLSGEEWAQRMLAVELNDRVPLEVRRLFAVARGALVYGYYFYPLYTLGTEQLFRVAEAAVRHKCQEIGEPITKRKWPTFEDRVAHLVEQGTIPAVRKEYWDALRSMRNASSHPEDQSIFSPGIAVDALRRISAEIEGLFEQQVETGREAREGDIVGDHSIEEPESNADERRVTS